MYRRPLRVVFHILEPHFDGSLTNAHARRMPAILTLSMLSALDTFDCIVLRGLPGSGKSTLAQRLVAQASRPSVHLEADQHFVVNGAYRFDPLRAADAHAVVVRDVLTALQARQRVVVANTHVRLWEMAAIVGAARLCASSLCFVECVGSWESIHAVPADAVIKMRERWEALPAEFESVSFRLDSAEMST